MGPRVCTSSDSDNRPGLGTAWLNLLGLGPVACSKVARHENKRQRHSALVLTMPSLHTTPTCTLPFLSFCVSRIMNTLMMGQSQIHLWDLQVLEFDLWRQTVRLLHILSLCTFIFPRDKGVEVRPPYPPLSSKSRASCKVSNVYCQRSTQSCVGAGSSVPVLREAAACLVAAGYLKLRLGLSVCISWGILALFPSHYRWRRP